jgi:hypothetical protein
MNSTDSHQSQNSQIDRDVAIESSAPSANSHAD